MRYGTLIFALGALSSSQVSAQSVYVAPGGVYIAAGQVYVRPGNVDFALCSTRPQVLRTALCTTGARVRAGLCATGASLQGSCLLWSNPVSVPGSVSLR